MFEHSVKVPRHFKTAANIFKKVSTEGGSVKTLLYDNKLRHFKTNVLYALITETIKHAADIDKIFEHFKVLKTETRLDPWLAKVLTTELLFGKKSLPGKSKPEQTILSYKEQFEKYVSDHQDDLKNEAAPRPRYVRINTNLLTTSDAIRAFQDEGYRFIRCTSGPYEDYLEQIQKLTEYDFTQDYHVKTMFVFAPGTKWHDHELYLENKIILQDKATALAVHLLAPPSGSVVLDMCAAPGMKTTQLAAYMRNEGKIYAVERNEKRYQTLCEFVEKTGCKCVETFHKDALEIRKGECDDVEYILLDPSCSGSGMDFCVHNYIEDTRLAKLTSLQEKFLKHATNAFPKAKRIVYSTCSLFPEENERVITNVVRTSRAKWRVQDVKELLKGQWNNIGSAMYGTIGTRCLYAKPDSDLTTGFFLAVLDRDEKDLAKSYRQEEKDERDAKKVKKNKSKNDITEGLNELNLTEETKDLYKETDDVNELPTEELHKKKRKKKKKTFELEDNIDIIEDNNGIPEVPKKKKKHNRKDSEATEDRNGFTEVDQKEKKTKNDVDKGVNISNELVDSAKRKHKKKRKQTEDNEFQQDTQDYDKITTEYEGTEEIVKKKKKKAKKECTETVEEVVSESTDHKVKKKRKHQQESIEIIDTEQKDIKKKKKTNVENCL